MKLKTLLFGALAFFALNTFAEEKTEGFEDVTIVDANGNTVSGNYTAGVGLSNGWRVVGGGICAAADYSNYGLWSTAYSGSKSLTAQYGSSNAAIVVIPEQLSGSFTFYARKTSSSSSTKGYIYIYEMNENGGTFTKGATLLNSPTLTTTWTKYTIDLGEDPRYVGINMIRAGVDEIVYNTYEAAVGPRLQVLQDGKAVKSGVAYNFGLVAEDATVEYTVKNAGTETMNATLACTGDYSVSHTSVSLEAGAEQTITITQSALTTGGKEGTMTITPEGLDAFTINLSGIVRDPAKLYVDFSTAPSNWTLGGWSINAGGYATIASNYYYSNASISSNKALQTALLKVEEGEKLFIRYRKNYNSSSSYYNGMLCFWASADGTSWTKVGENVTATEYNVWNETTISGFPTSTKYVAISGQYMDIDDFYGFALSNDPVMVIVGETITDNAITQNFGRCKENTTKTYTIKNIGGGALHVDLTNSNNIDYELSATSLDVAAGESSTFDLTFKWGIKPGVKNTTVTITPNVGDVVTINATAKVQDPEEFTEDFEAGIPASWTNNGWTIENAPSYGNGTKMVYSGYYNTNTLVTPRLQAKAGDVFEVEAMQKYNDEPLILEYSLDDGETWTQGFSEVPAANNTLHTLYFTAPETGVYLLRFSGRYNYIDNICGFRLAQIPVMEVSTTAGATREGDVFTDKFGRQTADASHTYTVANTGAGTLTVDIASNNAAFAVSEATMELGAGESKTFDVTFVHSNVYGSKAAVVTITPTNEGLTAVTINASAVCADPEEFFEDFEAGVPSTWTNYGWSIQTQSGSKMIYSNTSDDYKLTTPVLKANAGDVLTFDAYQKWNDEPLKLEYITFGNDWETAFEEAPEANNTARQFTFTAPADGLYQLRFSGSYNYIDNVAGFKLAPVQTVERATKNGFYGTICMPMNIAADNAIIYTATMSDNGEWLVLTEVSNTVAGQPYIYCATDDAPIFTMSGDMADTPVNTGILKGIFKETKATAGTYVMQTHEGVQQFYLVEAGSEPTLAPYRAYLDVPAGARTLGWTIGDEETAISTLNAAVERGQIYDLSGRKLNRLQKGINIVNGRTVLVK